MHAELALFQELEQAVSKSSDARRAEMVRHLTDLLVANVDAYSDDEITLLDDVFLRLVVTIEETARTLLAERLAPLSKAPRGVLHALACDDAIKVAYPILAKSGAIDEISLIECAKTKSQAHLFAISCRASLSEAITDVLVGRGDRRVVLNTAQNAGAKFSDKAFSILINRSRNDDQLATCVGSRPDIPEQTFVKLVEAASAAVRTKLAAEHPHLKHVIDSVVSEIDARIGVHTRAQSGKYAAALALVESLNKSGKLNPAKLEAFATANRLEDTVAALALMSGLSPNLVEDKLNERFVPFLLVLAKAIGLSWLTTRIIFLMLGVRHRRCEEQDLDHALTRFKELDRNAALKALSVYRAQNASFAEATVH